MLDVISKPFTEYGVAVGCGVGDGVCAELADARTRHAEIRNKVPGNLLMRNPIFR
jgi:hypothetical protein